MWHLSEVEGPKLSVVAEQEHIEVEPVVAVASHSRRQLGHSRNHETHTVGAVEKKLRDRLGRYMACHYVTIDVGYMARGGTSAEAEPSQPLGEVRIVVRGDRRAVGANVRGPLVTATSTNRLMDIDVDSREISAADPGGRCRAGVGFGARAADGQKRQCEGE